MIVARQGYRSLLVSSVASLVASEDPDEASTVSGWMSALSLAAQQSDELSVSTAGDVLSVAMTVIGHAADANIPYPGCAELCCQGHNQREMQTPEASTGT